MKFNFYYLNTIKKSQDNNVSGFLYFIMNSAYFTSINSTSNTKVASGGITPPAPLEPYPK